jgi:tRNA modification GTPase
MEAVDEHFRAASGRPLRKQPLDRVVFGTWQAGGHAEEIIVCRTGGRAIEIHCHGGVAAAQRILDALAAAGCGIESWVDWLRDESECPIAAEADVALAAAPTLRTAAILLDQREGALRNEIEATQCELQRDDSASLESARRRLLTLLERAAVGLRLARPWIVAVAGRPNVGKSSLVNAIAGYERAIVFDSPGTTRDVLAVETAIDGWPVRLTDSAGLRAAYDPLEAAGVELARGQVARADLVVWVLDATLLSAADQANPTEAAAREAAVEAGPLGTVPLVAAVNKADLVQAPSEACGLRTSAVTGAGIGELLASTARTLVPQAPPPGAAVPFTPRQVDALRAAQEHVTAGQRALAVAALEGLLR